MKSIRWALAGACVIVLAACGDKRAADGAARAAEAAPAPAGAGAAPMLPAVRIQLDSGNTAYRAKDYASAEAHYRAAVQLDSASAAAWFGVAMAADARGDTISANSARRRIEVLAPALSVKHPGR